MTATDPGLRPEAAQVAFALETGVYDGPAVSDPAATIALPAPGTDPADGIEVPEKTRLLPTSVRIRPSGSVPLVALRPMPQPRITRSVLGARRSHEFG